MYFYFVLIVLFSTFQVKAINHWVLKEDGKISQKFDSPFYMRAPDNLVAFLDQVRYNDDVEKSYTRLLGQRQQIVEHLLFSVQFGEDLVEQSKCAMDHYMREQRMSYLKVTPAYLERLNIEEHKELLVHDVQGEPLCQDATDLSTSPCCYDHLESFRAEVINKYHMQREKEMDVGDLGSASEVMRRIGVQGLKKHPKSWKFHTLSSYYWRMRGHAQNALACARLGVMLATRKYKDIPQLSLGTILFRVGRLDDADVILSAAVEHAPNVSENHIALASALAMKTDFHRSLFHFDEAERLNPGLLPRTLPARNFIACLENLTKKTAKMYSYVEYMKNEVKEFKKLKGKISQVHDKLVEQQVPLSARFKDTSTMQDDLVKRGQYCSTRVVSDSKGPVLLCDFYTDMQMRLESTDAEIDSLAKELKITSKAVIRHLSTIFQKQWNFQPTISV